MAASILLCPECQRPCKGRRGIGMHRRRAHGLGTDPEEVRARNADCARARRRADPEKARQQLREYYKRHPERRDIYARRHYERHREEICAKKRASYPARKERAARYHRTWQKKNRERCAFLERRWYAQNPQRAQSNRQRRRGRKLGAAGHASPEQLAARIAFYGGRCWMCGAPWEHWDHVIPLSAGGSNWPANLRPACATCNCTKGARKIRPSKAA